MCLDFATPYGFLSAKQGHPCYPPECPDKGTLLNLISTELASGHYDDPAVYNPLLPAILRGLTANHAHMNPRWSEPRYPFCDVIQAVALLFGFANGAPRLVPTRQVQDCFLQVRIPQINWQVYTIVRSVVTTCVADATTAEWQEQMERWLNFSGIAGILMEMAENDPDGPIRIESRGLVPG